MKPSKINPLLAKVSKFQNIKNRTVRFGLGSEYLWNSEAVFGVIEKIVYFETYSEDKFKNWPDRYILKFILFQFEQSHYRELTVIHQKIPVLTDDTFC